MATKFAMDSDRILIRFHTMTPDLPFKSKVIPILELPVWRANCDQFGRTVVATNGCFDLLHTGHLHYLYHASRFADALVVGVNSDRSVQFLKGAPRPIVPQDDRALMLAAYDFVAAVVIFDEPNASRFLTLANPHHYVKGSDYSLQTLNKQEKKILESLNTKIHFIPLLPDRSTTTTLAKANLNGQKEHQAGHD